ncbi:F0F1 ATP synthase subunit delta [Desulfobulbus oligotrophicus]|uniref:ATP synthase subunit delta n=1 Tax=Desulfobulbus oligotrophicus TaxID=1909699 RepID=A0A7T6AQC3_9BACT|nr:F0F1 ATP synthase subunit delta [Desulfobulbus oligotrophicus]MDY0389559.1 F0F1 ATP synthase subunit delta [Desulfobulbus oligotrophicus]QQG65388.1 F0F1 ATP synthase subunit delta [Desulfobulbus oligotrophicus]
MRNTILARRYAKALFLLGKETGTTEHYAETLHAIAALYADDSIAVADAVANPLYPLDVRQKVMAKIAESVQADAIMTRFLDLLVEKKRSVILPDIALAMQNMVDKDQNISHGTVVSAVELDTAVLAKIQATLEKITGTTVTLETKIDSSIIGGIVAKVGDLVLDGSIKTQLHGLKESIKGRE